MKSIELKEIVGGALQEQFSEAFESVIENLQNPNTSFKAPREITIKLKFVQSERRDDAKCAIQVSAKLAPSAPMETAFAIGKDLNTGKLYAEEYGNQMKIRIDEEKSENVDVDTETGEILDIPGKIIDLRKAAN